MDQPLINWHKIFKTDEYIRSMHTVNKKQLMNQNNINSRQLKDMQNKFKANSMTQR